MTARRVAATVVVVALGLALGACGGDGDDDGAEMTAQAFQEELIAREQYTPETAECISGYLYDAFPAEQLQALATGVSSGVPPQLWGRYTQVVLACQYHDELGVPGP